MLADFLAYIWPALPAFFLAGCCFVLAGGIWLVAIRRHEVTMGPDPVLLPVVHTEWSIDPVQPVEPNYQRRPDSDTGVVACIPGATRQAGSTGIETDQVERVAGPVCPTCGGPWHALCPSAPKERSEETVVLIPPVADLAAQYAALGRFFATVDETRADTDQAMGRLVDDLAGRDDCPLTTQEIVVPDATETPVHRAIADREPTQELSKTVAKILEAQR